MSYQELFIKKLIEAVKNDGLALEYVPEKLKTPEICSEAVKNYGIALRYVQEEPRTPEKWMESEKTNVEDWKIEQKELTKPM